MIEVAAVIVGGGREGGVEGEGCSGDRVTGVTVGMSWRRVGRVREGPGTCLNLQRSQNIFKQLCESC